MGFVFVILLPGHTPICIGAYGVCIHHSPYLGRCLSVLVPMGFVFIIPLPGHAPICIGAYGVCIRHSLTWPCAYLYWCLWGLYSSFSYLAMRPSVLVPMGFVFIIPLPGHALICIGAYGVCIHHSLTWPCAHLYWCLWGLYSSFPYLGMRLSVLVPMGFVFVIPLPGYALICIGAYGFYIRHSLTWVDVYLYWCLWGLYSSFTYLGMRLSGLVPMGFVFIILLPGRVSICIGANGVSIHHFLTLGRCLSVLVPMRFVFIILLPECAPICIGTYGVCIHHSLTWVCTHLYWCLWGLYSSFPYLGGCLSVLVPMGFLLIISLLGEVSICIGAYEVCIHHSLT